MEIIIGRKKPENQLLFIADKKPYVVKEYVPQSVSGEHAAITVDSEGNMTLRNLKPTNFTYVNGQPIESKRIQRGDRIELGMEYYPVPWQHLNKVLPRDLDISHLRYVWQDYEDTKMKMQINNTRFNTIRSSTGIFSMVAIMAGMIAPQLGIKNPGAIQIPLYVLAVVLMITFFIVAFMKSDFPKRMRELDKEFQHNYVCPNPDCRHFMGNNPYDIISQNKACPYCKQRYSKK